MHPHSWHHQRPQSSQTLSTGSNDHIATIQNPSVVANIHQNDLRCHSEQTTRIDSYDQPSKGESNESYYYNNGHINVISTSQCHFQTVETTPPPPPFIHSEIYQRLGVIPSDCSYFNIPQFPEEQHLQCRENAYLTQMTLPTDHQQCAYIPMFQNNKISSGQDDEIIEKLEYDQPITETHRITPFDTRFIQGQHQFHPHQFQQQCQYQRVPYSQKYFPQSCLSSTSCQQSCNICEENTYYQHNNPIQQQQHRQHMTYPNNCLPINQGEIPNTGNVPSQLISDQKLENQEDPQEHNENDNQQDIQQDPKIEYQEEKEEEEEDDKEVEEDDEEQEEDEKDLSQNNQNILSNDEQLNNNNPHFNPQNLQESQSNIYNNKTLEFPSSHHTLSNPQKPPRNYIKKSSKQAQIMFIGKRLNTKEREYSVVEETKTKKEIGKLKQFHNHLKVFMLQSCKYIQEQLLKYPTNELDCSNDNSNETNSTLQLQQHIQYLTYFKHRFQKSDLAYFLKKPEYIAMQEVIDIMNIEPLKARLLAQRRIVYLFIIISSFASNQLVSCMFSQSDCQSNNSINLNRASSFPSQLEQLPQENPENSQPKLMSSFNLLSEGDYDEKLAIFKDMTKTFLLEHLRTHPQTLDLLNSHVAAVNTFNRYNRSLIMRLCVFQLGEKVCKKKAMKFNQFYTKNYIMQTLLSPDVIE